MRDGERVRAWRKLKNKGSIRAFARDLGWAKSKLHAIESGRQDLKETDRDTLLAELELTVLQFYGDIGDIRQAAG